MTSTDRAPIIIARFSYRAEGELALGFLQDGEIPCALFVDDAGGAEVGLSFANPARLVVPAEFEEDARQLLVDVGVLEDPDEQDASESGIE